MPAYRKYFDNFFATLPISRVNFKELGAAALTAVREAKLGQEFAAHETALAAAIDGFDERLVDATEPTDGDTAAFRAARKTWLTFVDDTMKDYVTPKLRKLPVYTDFKKYNKSKLSVLSHAELLQKSKSLLSLYAEHHAAMKHDTLPADAQAAYQQLASAHAERGSTEAAISSARVALSADWLALAQALRRLKAQLELRFDEPEQAYRFFDFSNVYASARKAKKKPEGAIA